MSCFSGGVSCIVWGMETYQVSDLRKNPAPIVARVLAGEVAQITRHNDVALFMVPVQGYIAWALSSRGQPDAVAATVGDLAAALGISVPVVSAMVQSLCAEWGRNRVILADAPGYPADVLVHRDAAQTIADQLTGTPPAQEGDE